MNLLDLTVKVGVDDQASGKMEGISTKAIAKAQVMGQAFYDAAKFVGGKALDMGKMIVGGALEGYKAFEQLEGGAKLAFGGAYDYIEKRSKQAYKNVQMSRNEYLEQVNGFAVGLRESLGGNQQAAAELADKIITAEADIVAATGNTQENVQNAFNGIMKGNYTMLDNLQLGIKPSKEGMQEVIDKVNQWRESQGEAGNLTIDSLADCEAAVVDYVKMMGYAGYAGKEAMGTIEGSLAATKAAWSDLLTAIGSGNEEDIRTAVGGLVQGIFGTWDDEAGKRVGGIINNVAPVIQRVGNAIMNELPSVASMLGYQFVELLLSSFGDNLDVDGIMSELETAMQTASQRIGAVFDGLRGAWDSFSSTFDTSALSDALDSLGSIGEHVWGFVESNVLPNLPTLGEILGEVANFMLEVGDAVLEALDSIGPFVPAIAGAVAALSAASAITPIFAAISGAVTFFTTVIVPALGMVQSFGGAIALVTTLLGGPIPIIIAVAGALIGFIATNDEAKQAIVNAWQSFVDFISGIPAWWSGVWNQVTQFAQSAVDRLHSMWTDLKNKATTTWNNIKSTISTAMNSAKDAVINAMAALKNGVVNKFNEVVDFVRSIPSRIKNAIGDLSGTLSGAGSALIGGLFSGITSKAEEMFNYVSGIAGNIQALKGPLPYDRKVLIPNGIALMQSLQTGLSEGYKTLVEPYLSTMASQMAVDFGAEIPSAARAESVPSIYIGEMVVRDRRDAEYFARKVSQIWTREMNGALA